MHSFLLLAGNISYGAIVDIVALCVILVFFIIGIVKGFACTFISIFGRFISLLLAVLLCSSMTAFLNKTFDLTNLIAGKMEGLVAKIFGEELINATLADVNEVNIQNFSISNYIAKIILDAKNVGDIPQSTTIGQVICPALSFYVVAIISGVILYVIFRIVLFIVGDIIKKARKISVVGHIDRLFGAILGFVWGVVLVQIFISIINVVPMDFFQKISQAIDSSTITTFINKINVFGLIMNGISKNDIINSIKGFINK